MTGVQPPAVASGSTDVGLTLIGSGFASGATVVSDSTELVTVVYVSPTELQVLIPGPVAAPIKMQVVNTDQGQSDIFELGIG